MGHDILLNKKDFVLIRFFLLKNLFNNFRKNKTKQLIVYRSKQKKGSFINTFTRKFKAILVFLFRKSDINAPSLKRRWTKG